MLKTVIVVGVICAGSVGAALWLRSSAHSTEKPAVAVGMPSLEELHAKAHVENLPVQEIKDLY